MQWALFHESTVIVMVYVSNTLECNNTMYIIRGFLLNYHIVCGREGAVGDY